MPTAVYRINFLWGALRFPPNLKKQDKSCYKQIPSNTLFLWSASRRENVQEDCFWTYWRIWLYLYRSWENCVRSRISDFRRAQCSAMHRHFAAAAHRSRGVLHSGALVWRSCKATAYETTKKHRKPGLLRNRIAMASNLLAMASNPNSSDGLHTNSDGHFWHLLTIGGASQANSRFPPKPTCARTGAWAST